MSLASKLTLGASCIVTSAIVIHVHYKQEQDLKKLKMGVINDLEKQRRRKIENTYLLTQQTELAKELKRDLIEKERNDIKSQT